jgi:chemotaxis regulatin CheY-phosphate phosphatase CheZ
MKVLVVDNESDVRGNYRRLLREVGGDDGDFDETYEPAYPAPPPPPVRLRPRHQRQHRAEQPVYQEPQVFEDEYNEPEGYETNFPSSFGSEHMSSFAQTSDAHFAAAEDAVLQSPRGRWFLAEYLRRHRGADTDRVLTAIEALKTHVSAPRDNGVVTTLRRELQEIAVTIVHVRRDIAALKLDPNGPSFAHSTDDLDAVVAASERATGDILSSVERLQDVSLRLRSKGGDLTECEAIETQAISILRACSSQDITGQRVTRIVNALRIVEQRVATALDALIANESDQYNQYNPPRPAQDFTRQTQPRPDMAPETSWVTPAADRIIRGEQSTEPPFEHSVARAY